jgi:ketosteroid isomerase-like protein
MGDGESANIEALEPIYAEWSEGRFGTWFEVFADDYEWGFSPDFPEGAVAPDPGARGAGESGRLRAWLSPWHEWRCLAERYIPLGDQVLVLTRYLGVAKTSGLPVDQEGAHLWRLREGKAVRLEVFPDRRAALKAIGIDASGDR